MHRQVAAGVAALTIGLMWVGGCAPSTGQQEALPEAPRNVRVLPMAVTDLHEYFEISGAMQPLRGTDVAAEESGTVAALPHDKGTYVRQGDVLVGVEMGRVPECFHGQQCLRARRDGRLDGLGAHVVGVRVDVGKDRCHVLEQETVRRGDKGEGRGHHLIAGPKPDGADTQVEPAGPTVHRDTVLSARPGRDRGLKLLDAGPDA